MTQPPRIRRDPRDPASLRVRTPAETAAKAAAAAVVTVPDDAPFVLAAVDLGAGRLSRDDRDLMGAARTLADALSGGVAMLAFLPPGAELRTQPGREGADRVLHLTDPAYADEEAEPRVAGVLAAAERARARHLLFPDTVLGADLARRVAARLNDRAAFDVRRLGAEELTADIDAGQTEVRRRPPRVIVPGRAMFAPPAGSLLREARTIAVEATPSPLRLRRGGALPLDPTTLPLAEAELIISAGNGLIDWDAFHRAADLLGAAEAGSRVVCDAGLLPRSRQVGASGTLVAPRCYLAFGIAGASQHLQGIAEAERVVAVNIDLHAEMIKRADLAIVADAQAVLPALVRRVEARRGGDGSKLGIAEAAPGPGERVELRKAATPVPGAEADGEVSDSAVSDGDVSDGDVLALVSIGRHPVSGRPRRAEFEARALELALAAGRLVTAVHAGPASEADAVLRDHLGAGAGGLTILDCPAGSDPLPLLEGALRSRRPRLVVAGARTEAGESSGMLPFLLAERLGYAIATNVVRVRFTDRGVQLVRALPGGRRRLVETEAPLIVTVDRRGPSPRLSARMPALRGRVSVLRDGPASPDDGALWPRRPGRPRPRRLTAPSLAGISGGNEGRREMVAPDPDMAADAILDFLERDGLLAIAKEARA